MSTLMPVTLAFPAVSMDSGLLWSIVISCLIPCGQRINWQEQHAVICAAVTWASQWVVQHVLFHCDNECIYSESSTRVPAKALYWWRSSSSSTTSQPAYQFAFHNSVCSNTKDNVVADTLSRGQCNQFYEVAPDSALGRWPCTPL